MYAVTNCRWSTPLSIERSPDVPLGLPSPEALQLASDTVRRRYVLPETMQHSAVRSEILNLAYMIQAYGLVSNVPTLPQAVQKKKTCWSVELHPMFPHCQSEQVLPYDLLMPSFLGNLFRYFRWRQVVKLGETFIRVRKIGACLLQRLSACFGCKLKPYTSAPST